MLASLWQPGAARGVGLAVALVFVAARAAYRRARRRAGAPGAAGGQSDTPAAGREGAGDASQAFAQRDEDP